MNKNTVTYLAAPCSDRCKVDFGPVPKRKRTPNVTSQI